MQSRLSTETIKRYCIQAALSCRRPGGTIVCVRSRSLCAAGQAEIPQGGTNETLDKLAAAGATWTTIDYEKMMLNGGGIHCSAMPLIRDPD